VTNTRSMAQIASYVSIISSLGSVITALTLIRQHRTKNIRDANQVVGALNGSCCIPLSLVFTRFPILAPARKDSPSCIASHMFCWCGRKHGRSPLYYGHSDNHLQYCRFPLRIFEHVPHVFEYRHTSYCWNPDMSPRRACSALHYNNQGLGERGIS